MADKKLFYALVPLMEKGYNFQEVKILQLAFEKKMNISEISKASGIDYKNAHRYVKKLCQDGLIIMNPKKPVQGKRVDITLSEKTLNLILDELESIVLKKEYYKEMENTIKEARRKLRHVQLSG